MICLTKVFIKLTVSASHIIHPITTLIATSFYSFVSDEFMYILNHRHNFEPHTMISNDYFIDRKRKILITIISSGITKRYMFKVAKMQHLIQFWFRLRIAGEKRREITLSFHLSKANKKITYKLPPHPFSNGV